MNGVTLPTFPTQKRARTYETNSRLENSIWLVFIIRKAHQELDTALIQCSRGKESIQRSFNFQFCRFEPLNYSDIAIKQPLIDLRQVVAKVVILTTDRKKKEDSAIILGETNPPPS